MSAHPAGADLWPEGHPDDLVAPYVLGVLEPAEEAAVAAHVAGCDRCAAEARRLRVAADALPLAAPAVAPPSGSRAALLRRVRGEAAPAPARPPPLRWWPRAAPASWAGWAVAAASLAVAVAAGGQWLDMRRQLVAAREANSRLVRAQQERSLALASFDPASTRFLALRGSEATPQASGRVVYDARARRAVVVLENLPRLAPGKTYQLWLLQGGEAAPLSAGTLQTPEDGLGTVLIDAPAQIATFAGIGVTLEPEPGSVAPTGPLVVSGAF